MVIVVKELSGGLGYMEARDEMSIYELQSVYDDIASLQPKD